MESTTTPLPSDVPPFVLIDSPTSYVPSHDDPTAPGSLQVDNRITSQTNISITVQPVRQLLIDGVYQPDVQSWSLVLHPLAGGRDIPLTDSEKFGKLVIGTASAGQVVCAIDPSLYPSGLYNLVLTATDNEGHSSALPPTLISLFSNVKLGGLTLPVNDVTINIPGGQPLTISRVYDSQKANIAGPLGYGWQLKLSSASVTSTVAPVEGVAYPGMRVGDYVYVTAPDGQQYTFEFLPVPENYTPQNLNVGTSPYDRNYVETAYNVEFISVDGSGATLSVPGDVFSSAASRYTYIYNSDTQTLTGNLDPEGNAITSADSNYAYNPENPLFGGGYTLTTSDGSKYAIDPANGTLRTTDPNGNVADYSNTTGSSAGYSINVGSEIYNVVSVQVRNSNNENIATVDYTLNNDQQLIAVHQRDTNSNTTYAYWNAADMGGNANLLKTVIDARGVPVLNAAYNDFGNLLSLTDADGNAASIGTGGLASTGTSQQVSTSNGDKTESIYDAYGDVTRTITTLLDSGNAITGYSVSVTKYTYDSSNLSNDLPDLIVQDSQGTRPGATNTNALLSVAQYQTFTIAGSDTNGLRYSTPPTLLLHETDYATDSGHAASGITPEPSRDSIYLGQDVSDNSRYRVTHYGNYSLGKPGTVKQTLETIDNTGRLISTVTLSQSSTTYDSSTLSTPVETIDPLGAETFFEYTTADNTAVGQPYEGLPSGLLLRAYKLLHTGVDPSDPSNQITLSSNTYYMPADATTPGASVGRLKYSIDAADQKTFYAYDALGNTVLSYTYKVSQQFTGWVGTTTRYDAMSREIETDRGEYLGQTDSAGNPILTVVQNGIGEINIGETPYSGFNGGNVLVTGTTAYTADGKTESATDQYGNVTRYSYDAKGNQIRVLYSDGTEVRTAYDQLGRAVWQTDRYKTNTTYDAGTGTYTNDNTTTALATETHYDSLGRNDVTTRCSGVQIGIGATSYGSVSIPTAIVPASFTTISATSTIYNDAGQSVESVSASGLLTGTIYYPDGSVQFTGPLDSAAVAASSTPWYTQSDPTQFFLVNAATHRREYTTYLYDQVQTLTDRPFSGMLYDRVKDANGNTTDTYKDASGRVLFTVYDDVSFTQTLYGEGNEEIFDMPAGVVRPTIAQGWPGIATGGSETIEIAQRKVVDAPVATFRLYDASGRLTDVFSPPVADAKNGNVMTPPHTQYGYNASGDQTTQTDADLHTTTFTYDENSNQISRTLSPIPDPNNPSTLYSPTEYTSYDPYGKVMTHTDFDGNVATYSYYSLGETASVMLSSGDVIQIMQPAGALKSIVNSPAAGSNKAAQTVTYMYDSLGRSANVMDATGMTIDSYDPQGNLSEQDTPEGTIHYVFDPATGRHMETFTDKTHTAYLYNILGQLYSVTVNEINGARLSTPAVTTYGYDAVGNKISEVLPNGVTMAYTYDDLNRLTNIVEKNSANVTLFSEIYTLNSDGTRALATERQVQPDGSFLMIVTTWTYDAMDRLRGEAVTSAFTAAPNEAAPPNGLAGWLTLPAADADWGNQNPAGIDVVLVWNGNAYVSPGLMVDDVRYANTQGAALVPPAAAVRYGGNGTDWLLMTSDGGSGGGIANFTFSQGVLTVDGNGVLRVDGGAGDPNYGWASITIGNAAPSYTDTFSYDPASNRMKKIHIGPGGGPSEIITYTYNSDNELTKQVSTLAGETDFTYDPNGSLITQVSHAPTYSVHLDGSFGSSGMVAPEGDNATIYAQTVLANGKILASGCVTDSNNNPFISLFEFNADGSRNTAFGSGGMVNTSIMGISTAVSVLANGDIVLLGSAYADGVTTTTDSIVLAEFHANGTANASFGTDGSGIMLVPAADGTDGWAMSVLSNGTIVVAGYQGSGQALLMEFNANGTPNTTFGTGGVAPSPSGMGWNLLSVLPNGDLLVCAAGRGSIMSEYDATGHLVRSFGTNGIASLDNFFEGALTVLSNGQILVGGTLTTSCELAVEKFNADGTPDTSFGSGGMAVSTSEVGAFGPGYVLSALPSGDILVGGSALDGGGYMYLMLAEFRSDGSVEGSFGTGGVMLASVGTGGYSIQPEVATLLPNGEILIGGWMQTMLTTNLFLAKYQVDSVPAGYGTANQTTTYTYDVKGKLVSVSTNGHVNATYTYDDAGNRVSETVGGATTLYLTDTQNPTGYAEPIKARDATTGAPIMTWILGDRVLGQADANRTMTYLLTDGHGSTRLLTNATGTVTAAFNYDAFGTATNFNAGMAATPFLFGGDSMYDAPSGLDMHGDGTRPRQGFEFIQEDFGVTGQGNIADPISLHKYLYAGANPVMYIDASGHDFTLTGLMVTAGIGASLGAIIGGGAAIGYNVKHNISPLSKQGLENVLLGVGVGAAAGALVGAAAYTAVTLATAGLSQISGGSQLLAKLALPHSTTETVALSAFAIGFVAGILHPEIEQLTGFTPTIGLIGSASATSAILGTDVLVRTAMRDRNLLITAFGASGFKAVRTILFTYGQSSTFIALGGAIGFTAGYALGYDVRDYVIDPIENS